MYSMWFQKIYFYIYCTTMTSAQESKGLYSWCGSDCAKKNADMHHWFKVKYVEIKRFFICRKFEDFLPACLYFCSVRCFSNVYLVLNQSFYTLGRQDNGFEVAGFFSPFFSRFFTLKPKRQNVSFSRICEKTKTVLAFWRFFDSEIFVILKWCLKDCISWTL